MMDSQITIALAGNINRHAIIALLQAEKLPVDDLPALLDNFFIAFSHETIVGAGGIELYGRYGLLRSLVVDENYRNRSIAENLAKAIEKRAGELQLKSLYLLTETAKSYFEKKGYTTISRDKVPEAIKLSSEFSHVCPVSAVVMQKKII